MARRLAQQGIALHAGDLRHMVILQMPGGARNSVGQRVTTWTDVTTVPAGIYPLSAREQFIARSQQASTTHIVTIRWSPLAAKMNSAWRIKFGARNLILDGDPRNIDERNITLEMTCTEGLRDE